MSIQIQKFQTAVSFDFSSLPNPSLFSDCTIIVGNESFNSHRILLSGISKTLCSSFSNGATTVTFSEFDPSAFGLFLSFLYTGAISLSAENLPELLRIACFLEVAPLLSVLSEFVDRCSSARTAVPLLRSVGFALDRLPNFLRFVAGLIEALTVDTDFGFLSGSAFKLLIRHARFTSADVKDEVIRKYIAATETAPENGLGEVEDTIGRTAYSAVFVCKPPDVGLLRSMASQVRVVSSGTLSIRDPTSIIEEQPKKHWFTESDGNAWVLFEFAGLFVHPTDYAIWSHGGASTLRNWMFQGSNDREGWVVLSRHQNDETVRAPFSTATWAVNTNGFFKYFRVLQTGNNWSGNGWLYLLKLEIWGIACSMDL
jgi:hypothetical protein